MIVFNLQCSDCSHSFEGWFGSSKSCETQIKKNLFNVFRVGPQILLKNFQVQMYP